MLNSSNILCYVNSNMENPNISLFTHFTFNFIFCEDFMLLCNRENWVYSSLELF